VALVKGNHGIFRAGVQLYTGALGHAVCLAILCPRLRLSQFVVRSVSAVMRTVNT
jgi:hypothetical protein